MENGRGAMDYRFNSNSRIMAVKWVQNSVVYPTSNFVGNELIWGLERWCKKEMRKGIPCPQIVQQYNKIMRNVDLMDILLSLYRIPFKTMRWYQKIFWHLIDMTKINAWVLHYCHFCEDGKPYKGQKNEKV